MPPPPTPTHPANQAYFNTILNPSQIANAQSPSSASPFSANKAATSSSTTPTHASNTFKTPREKENERLMRSAQARNKTYRNEIDEGGRQGGGSARATIRGGGGAGRGRSPESFDARQKREWAAAVLANLEMVIWYAGVRNEVYIMITLTSLSLFSSFCFLYGEKEKKKKKKTEC
ncbi:unnamed protein product [Periconia digitata]|uniref:Uncharacterized protein n=1 Tax=Periconia digitata TaxID=1303443 RepID=A0A9W4UQE5_9PLEO|nr:unnamed protein product [Periconia digitata]